MTYLPALNPVVKVWDNPLCTVDGELEPLYEYQPVVGLQMRQLIPHGCGRAVLIVNGEALMQAEWHRPVLVGDVIEWHILSGGGNTSRTVLSIVAMIAIAYFTGPAGLGLTGWQAAAASIALNLAAQVLINALVPISPMSGGAGDGTSPGSVYNTALSGNQARLHQPIPVLYGRMKTFPDFACQPYVYFKTNDQYYNVLLCIGEGEYAIEALTIDDTPLANFKGVFYKVLAPGVAPTVVKGNIVTASEVAGNQLDADTAIGPFIVCKARKQVNRIEWDVSCDQGLGIADTSTGVFSNFTIAYDVDIQYVDDFGRPLGDFTNLVHASVTAKSRTPQRFTGSAVLPTAGRVSVRLTRTTALDTRSNVLNVLSWTGLRGELTDAYTGASTATYIEVSMRANEQLNGLTQKRIGVISRRKLSMWDPVGGWSAVAETRNPCWAILDALKNTTYGAGRSDSEIDLTGYYNLAQTYDARQDRLDILFDSRVTVKDALRTMAQTGRAVVFQRAGVHTIARDQYQALPFAAYSSRDIVPGSTSIGYALVTPETPDGIIYEYFDSRSWDWVPLTEPLPGVITPTKPQTIRIQGITGETHARREVKYLAAQSLYRRKFPKWQTEMKGMLAAYGSAVIYSPALPGWGQSGDVVEWDLPTLTARLSEPVTFTSGSNHFITLEKPTGALTIAIPVTPGVDAYTVVLGLAPGFSVITNPTDVDRTKFIFGKEGQHQVIVRLTSVTGRGRTEDGNPIIEMAGVAENNLVHTADNAYLPAGGVIQDPVPDTTIEDSASTVSETSSGLNVASHTFSSIGTPDSGGGLSLLFNTDGTFGWQRYDNGASFDGNSPTSSGTFDGEWVSETPEPGFTALYQINVTSSVGATDGTGGTLRNGAFGTWLPLSANQKFTYGITPAADISGAFYSTTFVIGTFHIRIRKVGTTTNLVDADITFMIFTSSATIVTGGGGG